MTTRQRKNVIEADSSLPLSAPSCSIDRPPVASFAAEAFPRPPKVERTRRIGGQIAVAVEPHALCETFGVEDADLATGFLCQLLGFLQPDPKKPIDPATINRALAAIQGIRPAGAVEAILAVLLVAAQHAAFDSMRRAAHPAQTPVGRQTYTLLALKAMHTCRDLVESLYVGRGKSVRQDINVTHAHVTFEAGAQAMVGTIDAGRGVDTKVEINSVDRGVARAGQTRHTSGGSRTST